LLVCYRLSVARAGAPPPPATGRQCADTVLPTGFDCLTSAVIPAQAGIQTLAFRAYFKAAAFLTYGFLRIFLSSAGMGITAMVEQGGHLRWGGSRFKKLLNIAQANYSKGHLKA